MPIAYGYRSRDGRIEEEPSEQAAMKIMRTMWAEGFTSPQIAKRLTGLGYRTRRGNPFSYQGVHRLCRRMEQMEGRTG